ncbi:MAG: helix-turn-helix transcriptional regulator [Terriglobales bacterium]
MSIVLVEHTHFVYHQTMNVALSPSLDSNLALSRIAAAIGEPARARILSSLLDGHARTSTELAVVAEVSPSTASVHLSRLKDEKLIKVLVQGKHRYYSLHGVEVAAALEALSILAGNVIAGNSLAGSASGNSRARFVPNTPNHLRAARTCYDHIAGTLGVALHDRIKALGWLCETPANTVDSYDLSSKGSQSLAALGVDVAAAKAQRRRFAYACLDWSERRSHLGGAIGAALLEIALKRKWLTQHLDSRALQITNHGKRELRSRFGLSV